MTFEILIKYMRLFFTNIWFSVYTASRSRGFALQLPVTTPIPLQPLQASKLSLQVAAWANKEIDQINWSDKITAFSLTAAPAAAIGISIQCVSADSCPELTVTYHLLLVAITLALACIFVASFVRMKCPNLAGFLVHCGVLFGAVAFCFAASILASSFVFKWIIWAIGVLSLIIIVLVNGCIHDDP